MATAIQCGVELEGGSNFVGRRRSDNTDGVAGRLMSSIVTTLGRYFYLAAVKKYILSPYFCSVHIPTS